MTDELLVRYLLGELENGERLQIAERSFRDDEVFDRLMEAENDLVDRYVIGALGGRELELFERNLLGREHVLGKVVFARALNRRMGGQRQVAYGPASVVGADVRTGAGRDTRWYWAAAAAFLVMLAGGIWFMRWKEQRQPAGQTQAVGNGTREGAPGGSTGTPEIRTDGPAPAAIGSASPKLSERPIAPVGSSAGALATIVLLPGSTRSSDQPQVVMIGPAVRLARLELQLAEGNEYQTYGVVLRTARGAEVFRRSRLAPGRFSFGSAITMEFLVKDVAPGQYELELTGHPKTGPEAVVNYYYFILKRGN